MRATSGLGLALLLCVLCTLPGSSQASSCGASSFIHGTSCIQCPANTYQDTTDSYYCAPCPYGTQPNELQLACDACRPGTYRPHHQGHWFFTEVRQGPVSIKLGQSNLFLTRVQNGRKVRAQVPTKTINQMWIVVPAVNGGANAISLQDPLNPSYYFSWPDITTSVSSAFPTNMSASSGTTAWKNRASWLLTNSDLAQPNDANDIPMWNRRFEIKPFGNTTQVVSCETPALLSGAVDGDCYVRPISAVGTAFRWSSFVIAPSSHDDFTDMVLAPAATVATDGGAALAALPSATDASATRVVSLQTFADHARYPTEGADGRLYTQLPMFGWQAYKASFNAVPALDGTPNAFSFQSLADPAKYINAALSYTARGATSIPVTVSVPATPSDASFLVLQGVSNNTFALGYTTLVSTTNNTYYMWWNSTADRSNPVRMRNISNPLTALNWFEKEQITWRLVKGVSIPTGAKRDVVGVLKSRSVTANFLAIDESALTVKGAVFSGTIELHVTDPLGTVPDLACPAGHAHSLYYIHSTTGERLWVYVQNTSAVDDTYASYNVKATGTPTASTITSAPFPQAFVFCSIGALDSLTGAWGISLALSNDTGTVLLASGSTYTATRAISATQKQQATFYTHTIMRNNFVSYKSHASPCLQCAPGYISATRGRENCTWCAAGTFSDAGASSCTSCSAGRYQPLAAQGSCLACPVGTYSAAGATVCTDCAAGTFADTEGTAVCANCPINTYAGTTGASSCTLCAVDDCFTELEGSTEALSCLTAVPTTHPGKANCLAATIDRENDDDHYSNAAFYGLIGTVAGLALLLVLLIGHMCRKSDYSALGAAS